MRMRVTTALLLAVAALTLGACDDDTTPEVSISCDLPTNGSALAGEWTLRAEGKREDCDDRRYEGDLKIETTMPVDVDVEALETPSSAASSDEQGPDAFVERILSGDYELSLTHAVDDFELEGRASQSCVTFTLTEALGKDKLTYSFDGEISDSDYIQGNFIGRGPKNCRVAGSFTVDIR